jgi:hypothetical protein
MGQQQRRRVRPARLAQEDLDAVDGDATVRSSIVAAGASKPAASHMPEMRRGVVTTSARGHRAPAPTGPRGFVRRLGSGAVRPVASRLKGRME